MMDLKKFINVPNFLSCLRILLLIPLVIANNCENYVLAIVIFVIMGISDFLDGYIARRFDMVTSLGKILDPIADKMLIVTVMFCIGIKFNKMMPFAYILLFKESLMLIAGAILLKKKKVLQSSKWYGKLATFLFFVSVTVIIILKAFCNIENDILIFSLMFITVG